MIYPWCSGDFNLWFCGILRLQQARGVWAKSISNILKAARGQSVLSIRKQALFHLGKHIIIRARCALGKTWPWISYCERLKISGSTKHEEFWSKDWASQNCWNLIKTFRLYKLFRFDQDFQVLQIVSWKSPERATLHQGETEQGEMIFAATNHFPITIRMVSSSYLLPMSSSSQSIY